MVAGPLKSNAPSIRPDTDLARRVLVTFLFTFIASRLLVFLIMTHTIPDFFVHVRGTHVHHLNFGIILLSITGAWLLLWPPAARARRTAAGVYGIGLALTFDEFGMWLHLGGSYWQRASYDGVIVVAHPLANLRLQGVLATRDAQVGEVIDEVLVFAGVKFVPAEPTEHALVAQLVNPATQ